MYLITHSGDYLDLWHCLKFEPTNKVHQYNLEILKELKITYYLVDEKLDLCN